MTDAAWSGESGVPSVPNVGIFWRVPGDAGLPILLVDRVSLHAAEPYGECLTHPGGHFEVWSGWRALPAPERRRRGIPSVVAQSEYEDHPRGRIVYSKPDHTFWLYADRRLQSPKILAEIRRAFGLVAEACLVKSDAHYR